MSGVQRPCIERDQNGRACPRYAINGARCAEHERERERNRARSPSSTITWTARWKRVRAVVIRKRQDDDGTWQCDVCNGTITSASEIDVDHIVPVSDGGEPYAESNLRVAHRTCNRRLGGLTAAAQRQRRTDESRIGQALRARQGR